MSSSKTVQRVEVGENASGQLILISSPSIRLVILGANFSGMADFRESALVYASAAENCTGRFECNACANLTLLNMPKENGYKIVGTANRLKRKLSRTGFCIGLYNVLCRMNISKVIASPGCAAFLTVFSDLLKFYWRKIPVPLDTV